MAGKKLCKSEVEARVKTCFEMRYINKPSIRFLDWIQWCKKNYGNKSEQQYNAYWQKASDIYKSSWKQTLEDSVGVATDEMIKCLMDDDPRVRQRAIEQIFKYSGNEGTEKLEIVGNIELKWGNSNE